MSEFYTFDCGCKIPLINGKPQIDFHNLNLNCPKTWETYQKGHTSSVFQLNSYLGKKYSKELEPESLEDAAALIAIIRPATLQSKDEKGVSLTQKFCDLKTQREPIDYNNPLATVAAETYGIIIFQETIMQMAVALSGFSAVDSLKFMKTTAKKDAEALFAFEQQFLDGCRNINKVTAEQAKLIFENIKNASRYCFNKCSSGKEKIKGCVYKDFHPTISEMFKIKNDLTYIKKYPNLRYLHEQFNQEGYGKTHSMNSDQKIIINTIKDIRYEGKKSVFKVELESGESCVVTNNHKFPTPNGDRKLEVLLPNDELFIYCDNRLKPVKISRIKYWGQEDVYDVEMEAPNHTFVFDSGIVSCNSHSVAYAVMGYQMAWAITHLPKEFLCAQLMHAKDAPNTQEEVRKISSEARRLQIDVKPPSAKNLPNTGFFISGDQIYFALDCIKSCGSKSFTKINKADVNIEDLHWCEFLIMYSDLLNKQQIKNMIKTGCFDFMQVSRRGAEYEYDQWNMLTKTEKKNMKTLYHDNQYIDFHDALCDLEVNARRTATLESIKESLLNTPTNLNDSIDNIVNNERELLGISLSCSKIAKGNMPQTTDNCSMVEKKQKEYFTIVGEISEYREFKIKNGKMKGQFMSSFRFEDEEGSCDVVCFPDALGKYESCLFDGNVCVIEGKLSNRGGLILESVYETY